MAKQPVIISVEGNIGSGKSTFVENLKQSYTTDNSKSKSVHICFLQEPVDEWNSIIDKKGETILSKFYTDSKKFAFSFQMMAYISRLALLRKALKESYDIIVTERCVETDKMVFAQMLYDDGKMEDVEYAIYNKWFHEFIDDIPEIYTIYLKTAPDIAKQRVDKRARNGETIPLEYLASCHQYHERWLTKKDSSGVKVIDVNIDSGVNKKVVFDWVETAKEFINERLQTMKHQTPNTKILSTINTHVLFFDGGSRGNPGICGSGHVIMLNDEKVSSSSKLVSTENTNNYAEYMSIIIGLNDAYRREIKNLIVKGDSLLVINQITGKWKIRCKTLQELHSEVMDIITQFDEISFHHIPREENTLADKEANDAMDKYELVKSFI